MIFDALASGEIDAYVDYSGTLWSNQMKRSPGPPRWQVLAEVAGWLADQRIRSAPLGFENAYALAARKELGATSILELRGKASSPIGGDYEFFDRPEWRSVRDTYGLVARDDEHVRPGRCSTMRSRAARST